MNPAIALTLPSPIGMGEGKTGFDHVTRSSHSSNPKPETRNYSSFPIARKIFSGVIGNERTRTPSAS